MIYREMPTELRKRIGTYREQLCLATVGSVPDSARDCNFEASRIDLQFKTFSAQREREWETKIQELQIGQIET